MDFLQLRPRLPFLAQILFLEGLLFLFLRTLLRRFAQAHADLQVREDLEPDVAERKDREDSEGGEREPISQIVFFALKQIKNL